MYKAQLADRLALLFILPEGKDLSGEVINDRQRTNLNVNAFCFKRWM